MGYLHFGIRFLFNHLLFHKTTPLICGLVVTNGCNLHCRQCRIPGRGLMNLSFEEIKRAIDSFYQEGGRTLYIQGGEPFIWHDRDFTLDDIIKYSHQAGFFSSIIYTNGTFPLNSTADTIFVSVDGLQKTHDMLRGESFELIMKNIQASLHPSLYINFTINNHNKNEIEEFCAFIKGLKQIKGIFFYFHTPYYGIDELYIEPAERNEIMQKLLKLKKKYRILNSTAGLRSAIRNDWKRPLNICRVYEEGKTYECCRYPGNPELCRNCGYLSYAEIDQSLKLKPSALLNALKYF
ncbi:MAG: radical SAM protein [Candidatus Cloacimonetes bacterium]|nr:radical SAM protein [Candidatus Cloacimonadota bacterium]